MILVVGVIVSNGGIDYNNEGIILVLLWVWFYYKFLWMFNGLVLFVFKGWCLW